MSVFHLRRTLTLSAVIVGAPFVTLGLTVVPPRYWLPGSTLIMALFVLLMFKAQNIQTLYGLRLVPIPCVANRVSGMLTEIPRFCAGLFASGIQPGSYYIVCTRIILHESWTSWSLIHIADR